MKIFEQLTLLSPFVPYLRIVTSGLTLAIASQLMSDCTVAADASMIAMSMNTLSLQQFTMAEHINTFIPPDNGGPSKTDGSGTRWQ